MLEIIAKVGSLSPVQRKALADFIISFPEAEAEPEEVATIQSFVPYSDSSEEPTPEAVFDPLHGTSNTPGLLNVCSPVLVASPAPPALNVDTQGLPWDARIHTSSKATNVDGTWRRKRGVADALVTQVEGELRALMAIPAPPSPASGVTQPTQAIPASVPNPPVSIAPVAVLSTPLVPSVAPIAVTAPTVEPVAPPPPPAIPPASVTVTHIDVISRASELIGAKRLTMEQVNQACASIGGAALTISSLGQRPDLAAQVLDAINRLVAA